MTKTETKPTAEVTVPNPFTGPIRSLKNLALAAANIRWHESRLKAIDSEPNVKAARKVIEDANKRKSEITMTLAEYKLSLKKSTIGVLNKFFDSKGNESRTYKTDEFRVALKKTKGSLNPVDREKVIAWAQENAPNAIVTTVDVNLNKLTDEQKQSILSMDAKTAKANGFNPILPEDEVHWYPNG